MFPRILPWVPFPAPGAPNKRMARYFIMVQSGPLRSVLSLCIGMVAPKVEWSVWSRFLVFQLNFLDLHKRHRDLLGSVPLVDLQEHLRGGDAADAFGNVSSAGGFDLQNFVLF